MELLIHKFFNWEIIKQCWTYLVEGTIVTLQMALICLVTLWS